MFCPKCGAEYVAGFTRCSDCRVPLVDALPEQEEKKHERFELLSTEPLNLVTVLASGDSGLIAVAKSVLQSAGIPFTVTQNLFGIGSFFGGFNPFAGPAELRVQAKDADDARLLLQGLTEDPHARSGDEASTD